jgi:hypothetical protein
MTKKLRKLTDAQCRKQLIEIDHEVACGCTKRGNQLFEAYQDPRVEEIDMSVLMAIAMDSGPDMDRTISYTDKQLAYRASQIDRLMVEITQTVLLMEAEPMGHA